PPKLNGADLFVDIKEYVGREVLLTGARIYGASNSGALAEASGVTFKLSTDEIDRETLRYFLKNCSQIGNREIQPCQVSLHVTPTGKMSLNFPILKSVKIAQSAGAAEELRQ